MAKDVERCGDKYEYKLRSGQVPTRVDRDQTKQAESYRLGAERSEAVRQCVAAVLGRSGVPTIWWPFYYGFGRSLASLRDHGLREEIVRIEGRLRLELWVSRGLEREVLEAIGRECFQLDLAGAIPGLAVTEKPT